MRLEPTHYIKVWIGTEDGHTHMNSYPRKISYLPTAISFGAYPVALFLIRSKTTQEQEKSIYYPMLPTSMSGTSKPTNNE